MFIKGNKYLDFARINLVVKTLAEKIEMDQSLSFLDRTPIVPADENEIMTRFRGTVLAADLIADDQAAVAYSSGSAEMVINKIPNLKIGRFLSQDMLNRLDRMNQGIVLQGDETYFSNWEQRVANQVVHGIRLRANSLVIAMQTDSPSYDRFGFTLSGASWGTPSDLKVVAGTDWSNTASTPITDMETLIHTVAPNNYGKTYDRVTMTRKCFQYVTNTTEFRNRLSGLVRYTYNANELPKNVNVQLYDLSNILGVQIELYDGMAFEQNNAGNFKSFKALPHNKVVLSSTSSDQNESVMDFANGIVTESIVGSVAGDGFTPSFGPISYYAPSYNPPTITCWGVMRGFPRKHDTTATACITAGSGSNWA